MSLTLRMARPEDAGGVAEVYAPFVASSAISFEGRPPDSTEMADRIESCIRRFPWLVVCDQRQILGYAYATESRGRMAYQWSVETSVYIGQDHHRSGLGARLYGALFPLLAEQGFVNVFAGMTLPNPGSAALHRRFGFEPVGIYRDVGYKMGRWHDVAWFHKRLVEPPPEKPDRPRMPAELADSPLWQAAVGQHNR